MQVANINYNLNAFGYVVQQDPTPYDLIPNLFIPHVVYWEPVGISAYNPWNRGWKLTKQ